MENIEKKLTWREDKERVRKYNKEYRLKNKEKLKQFELIRYQKRKEERKEYNKEYRLKNKEKLKQYEANRYPTRKEERREYHTQWMRDRRNSDDVFKLMSNIRKMVRRAFFNKNMIKNKKTEEILGCTIQSFKLYIENKLESWMTWDNYGKYKKGVFNYGWDIDHIIPISSAKTEDDIIRLNYYTNLQPLCSNINRCIKRNLL